MSNRIKQRTELEIKEWIDGLPKTRKIYVKVMGVPFQRPKWWNDSRKISSLISIFKFATFSCYFIALVLLFFSLSQNVKNKDWQLYTFDQKGNVEWIKDIKKLQ